MVARSTHLYPEKQRSSTPTMFKLQVDSSKAWELKKPDGVRMLGYVDLGVSASKASTYWMAKVNCGDLVSQNFQLYSKIYYRSSQSPSEQSYWSSMETSML